MQEAAQRRLFGPLLREPLMSPPYLTALPEVTTTKIEPKNGDFLIMASEGMWDLVTGEQAVGLVSRWMQTHDVKRKTSASHRAQTPIAIPGLKISNQRNSNPDAWYSYTDIRTADEKQFVVLDDNAAAHLMRNALGGGNEDMLCGLLTVSPPYSRKVR